VDVRRLSFLDEAIRRRISPDGIGVEVSPQFETGLDGLYTVGLTAMENFGPVLRFMVGTNFVAPRLAAHLRRRIRLEKARAWISGLGAADQAPGLEPLNIGTAR
jgi:hypothetical protein